MTVSNKAVPKQYIGNGVTTSFSFPYIFYNEDDLEVYIDDDLQSSGYTVSGEADPVGGSVNFSSAPAVDAVVTIQRVVELKQGTDFRNFDGNPADVTEKQFDLNVMMAQQNASVAARSLKYPTTIYGITNASLPTPEDGKALVFLGTDGAITASSSYIADAVADATAAVTGASLVTATSTTSLTVTGTGEKTFTVLPSKGFALGMRLRASSDDGTKINEGLVTDYIDTALTINVDYVSGSGTHADWNIGVAGSRGAAGVGTGDMLSSNNLSDVASAATAFNTIKQAATDTTSGVVELATAAEVIAGIDTSRAVTSAGVSAVKGLALLDTQTASNSASLNFTSGIDGTYDEYEFHFSEILPQTDNGRFYMRTSSNGGSSYDSGASDYKFALTRSESGTSASGERADNAHTAIDMGNDTNWSNVSSEKIYGTATLYSPSKTDNKKVVRFHVCGYDAAGEVLDAKGVGGRVATTAINAVQFLMESGNIVSGSIRMYGVRKV